MTHWQINGWLKTHRTIHRVRVQHMLNWWGKYSGFWDLSLVEYSLNYTRLRKAGSWFWRTKSFLQEREHQPPMLTPGDISLDMFSEALHQGLSCFRFWHDWSDSRGKKSVNYILLHGGPSIRSLIPCNHFYKNYF